jgi:NitT/TauT family transport system permease protein
LLILKLAFAVLSAWIALFGWRAAGAAQSGESRASRWLTLTPWLLALALGISGWEIVTATCRTRTGGASR